MTWSIASAVACRHFSPLEPPHPPRHSEVLRVCDPSTEPIPDSAIAPNFPRLPQTAVSFYATHSSLRIGILHSRTGAMAVYEQPLIDAALLAIHEINQGGGVLGWPLEAVLADGGSKTEQFVSGARRLLEQERINTVFGGYTSDTRKAIIPLFEAHDALLWYPLPYEGVEANRNVFYTGACPNQQVEPAIAWLLSQGRKRFYLIGSDYIFPQLTHKIVRAQLAQLGGLVVGESHVSLGCQDFSRPLAEIQQLQPDAVFNTLDEDSQAAFYHQYQAAGIPANRSPIMSLCLSELDLERLGESALGHYASWGYFQSLDSRENRSFQARFHNYCGSNRGISDPVVTAYSQVYLWKQALESAESFKIDDIRVAAYGETFMSPAGPLTLDINHHTHRPCSIGQVTRPASGSLQFSICHTSAGPIRPLPWLGIEEAGIGNAAVVIDMLSQVSRSMQQSWDLAQKSAELEVTALQLQAEVLERHRAEEEARLLLDISQTMMEALTLESAMASAIFQVCRAAGWPYGEVWMPNTDGETLNATPIWLINEDLVNPAQVDVLKRLRRDSRSQQFHRHETLLGRVWATGEAEWSEIEGCHSAVAIPILATQQAQQSGAVGDRVLAILNFILLETRLEDKRLVRLVSAVAAQLGGSVQQKQAERALLAKNSELARTLHQLESAQDELIHSEKLVALGQLVAGIAHEINTPLGAICSSSEYIAGFLAKDFQTLPQFFQNLRPEQKSLLDQLLRSPRDIAGRSSREQRQRRRALQGQLEAAGIAQARDLSDLLITLQPSWEIEPLLPLLQAEDCLDFLGTLSRLLELKNSTHDIHTAAERASKVVFALKTYARYDHSGEQLVANMEESVDTILILYQNRLKQGIAVERDYGDIPAILCYPDELNQVWMNLVHNAIQAMGERGLLKITTRESHGWVRVDITDSGCGIPPAVQGRIFEPFFTTKPPGEGSGLGLDIVQKIVGKHGGTITVESVPGCTTFTVLLPVDGDFACPQLDTVVTSQPPVLTQPGLAPSP